MDHDGHGQGRAARQDLCRLKPERAPQDDIVPLRYAPAISTPVTWDEVNDYASGDVELRFEAPDVLARVEEMADVFAPVLTLEH